MAIVEPTASHDDKAATEAPWNIVSALEKAETTNP